MMNALTQAIFGLRLCSDTLFIHDYKFDYLRLADGSIAINQEEALWRKLVRMGLAEQFREGGKRRYVFLGKSDLFQNIDFGSFNFPTVPQYLRDLSHKQLT